MDRFKTEATQRLWEGRATKSVRRSLPQEYHKKARTRLDFVYQAASMKAFSSLPPGADFKELHGKLRGMYQLRISGPYRIRFRWVEDAAYEIEVGEFHDED